MVDFEMARTSLIICSFQACFYFVQTYYSGYEITTVQLRNEDGDMNECYYTSDNGYSYEGQTSRPDCLNWKYVNSPYAKYNEDHNYCRNPFTGEVSRPYCYISTAFNYELCDIPICDLDCYVNDGRHFLAHVTKPGCILWSQITYEKINFNEEHNFCRNPLPDKLNKPWCFTNARTLAFQFCDVDKCRLVKTCPGPKHSANLTWTPVTSTYYTGDAVVYSCKTSISLPSAVISECQENRTWPVDQPYCGEKIYTTTYPVRTTEDIQITNPTLGETTTLVTEQAYTTDIMETSETTETSENKYKQL